MCGVNHKAFARPGYLIDARAESIAPDGALFTRMLAHHRQVGLTGEQIIGLLEISRDYHAQQVKIRLEMARLGEEVEHKVGRLDAAALAARKAALARRADLFAEDELLFFEYAALGHELLSDDQLDRIDRVYHDEKNAGLADLAEALNSAVGPVFTFHARAEV